MALGGIMGTARGGRCGKIKLGQLGSVADLPFNLQVLVEAGVVKPIAPATLIHVGGALRRWGASPAAGIASVGDPAPRRDRRLSTRPAR